MDSDLLIKCFIAFCIVAIVCNLIYSSKLCNKDLVEGNYYDELIARAEAEAAILAQGGAEQDEGGEEGGVAGGGEEGGGEEGEGDEGGGEEGGVAGGGGTRVSGTTSTPDNTIINNINENIFNKSIQHTLSYVLKKIPGSAHASLPISIKATTTFDQFGDNEDSLNFLEMIVQKIVDMDNSVFKRFVEDLYADPGSYCEKDINEYIISIILLQYNKINTEKKDSYINISNRLSRYIPDILEKIQNVNITCGNDISARSNIMDVMFYRLFKNNNTIINIGSLDALVNELNNLPKVYGVVILLCITFIIVKIFGMFNMKLEV
jgi:hypothetical protein